MKNTRSNTGLSCAQRDSRTLLTQAGLRCTRERILVLSVLIAIHTPTTVEALYKKVSGHVNKVTLYRMLEQFADVGLTERVLLPDGNRRYEYQAEHHHHVTCTLCGTRARIATCTGDVHKAAQRDAPGFASVTAHTLEFYGICAKCAG